MNRKLENPMKELHLLAMAKMMVEQAAKIHVVAKQIASLPTNEARIGAAAFLKAMETKMGSASLDTVTAEQFAARCAIIAAMPEPVIVEDDGQLHIASVQNDEAVEPVPMTPFLRESLGLKMKAMRDAKPEPTPEPVTDKGDENVNDDSEGGVVVIISM